MLPDASIAATPHDKMSLYNQAEKDSAAMRDRSDDDLFSMQLDSMTISDTGISSLPSTFGYQLPAASAADRSEAQLRQKLSHLQQSISEPSLAETTTVIQQPGMTGITGGPELERLQQLMASGPDRSQADPEMERLNGMLEKILDIQHPDRVREQLRNASLQHRGRVHTVTRPSEQFAASVIGSNSRDTLPPVTQSFLNTFYEAGPGTEQQSEQPAAIPAVVQETQILISGSTIKMRLTEDVFINGVLIPRNGFVFGNCSVDGERLKITIPSVRYGNNLFPVTLSVYDLDGLEGIRIPGAINREVSKEGTDRAIQAMQLSALDPSIGAQAIGAGIEATKGLLSKKVKLIRVTVKAGYPVLLLDEKAKQNN